MIVIVIEGHSSEAEIEFLELWRRRWNVQRVGPPIGSMDEVTLDRGGHAQEFITNFITLCHLYLHCGKCKWHLPIPGS